MNSSLTIYPSPVTRVHIPQCWYQNNPVKTHFFNAMSTLFPQGENFFIWSIKNFSEQVQSEILQEQIRDFTTQEKNHAALHKAYNRCLAKAGYDINKMEAALFKKIRFSQDHLPPLMCLAATVATEHVTAVLGEKVLNGTWMSDGVDPEVRRLWYWHAMEEVDHKSVAMNVFQAVGGTYAKRARAMIYISFNFWGDTLLRMLHMLKKDRLLHKPITWWQLGGLCFGRQGILRVMGPDILKYFAPRFHPDKKDHSSLLARARHFLGSSPRVELSRSN